ncbi:hypothetical protein DICVIV_06804 [Dictyocaulus viviparus]|uniref:Uncharacterized protein n=1 Tax=Dictyocaulus viviparus TaxID=29172 RepID=A0A0D8XXL2_DICVI|nr:hypothetical protein DICVIV_06804 [Dictyocaulus viviparus]
MVFVLQKLCELRKASNHMLQKKIFQGNVIYLALLTRFVVACLFLTALRYFLLDYVSNENFCLCTDAHGNSYNFCYHSKGNPSIVGKRFTCDHLEKLRDLSSNLDGPSPREMRSPVISYLFLTSAAVAHSGGFCAYGDSGLAYYIASIRKYYKTAKIVVYDIGLSKKNAMRVKRWCHVDYRRFQFEKYPSYFKQLYTFRWKPIVIAEALKNHDVIWYMDTSIILNKSDLRHVYALVSCKFKSRVRFSMSTTEERDMREHNYHTEYAWDTVQWRANVDECRKATIYEYFPVSLEEMKKPKAKMYEAGLVSVLCALEEECMGTKIIPNTCRFDRIDLYASFPHCHRDICLSKFLYSYTNVEQLKPEAITDSDPNLQNAANKRISPMAAFVHLHSKKKKIQLPGQTGLSQNI